MKVFYQVMAGYQGHEQNTRVTRFRSKERALKAYKRKIKIFGNACLTTHSIDENGRLGLLNVEETYN